MMQFQKLVSATIKSFKRRCVPLDELVSHVMTLGAFDPVFKEPQAPVFCHCLKELKAADTIPNNDYFSFIKGHMDIVKFLTVTKQCQKVTHQDTACKLYFLIIMCMDNDPILKFILCHGLKELKTLT